jgi:anaerobic ribonucleoside-triphosphate reductase
MESCDKCSEECKYSKECLGEGVPFQRIRRITGYLTGDINTWNNGKKAELADREKHGTNQEE